MTTASAQRGTLLKFAKPKATLTTVTPAMAQKWLQDNGKNRNLRPKVVDVYARDMAAGNWQITGDAIRFAFDGTLLDGQHRLHAVIQSNTPVEMFVIRGLSGDTQEVMDSGAKRLASDALALRGYKSTALLSATARLALTVSTHGYGAIGHATFSTSEITAFVEEHPELSAFMQPASVAARHMDTSGTAVAYAMWRLYAIDPEEAADFFDKAATGIEVGADDPVRSMVRRFAEARRHRESLSIAASLSIIFRAWNARRQGKPLHRIPVVSRSGEVQVPEPVAR